MYKKSKSNPSLSWAWPSSVPACSIYILFIFDNYKFPGEVIEGFERGIAQMSLGQRVSLTLSPDMGYGEEGAGDGVIPPNAALIFDVEILNIQ